MRSGEKNPIKCEIEKRRREKREEQEKYDKVGFSEGRAAFKNLFRFILFFSFLIGAGLNSGLF